MKHVLILDDDPGAHQRLRRSLTGVHVCLDQATSLLAAYRRIAALPTLHVVIVNVAHPEWRAVEDFARRVIPAIAVIPVGPCPATPGDRSAPGGRCVPWSAVMEDLTRALPPGMGPGQTAAGRWTG